MHGQQNIKTSLLCFAVCRTEVLKFVYARAT